MSKDTIYRQAAIEAVSKACFELRGVFERCEDALKALPSAQPYIDPCETCQYSSLDWDEEPCDSCTMGGETNRFKPHTEADIQKMQDLEQAAVEKAFELGRQDAMSVIVSCT